MPPTNEEAVEILLGIRGAYERHHKATYTDNAIKTAVSLSARYVPGRFLPDKAIDLMDEAGAKARIHALHRPPHIHDLELAVVDLAKQKEKAIGKQDYAKAADFHNQEQEARVTLTNALREWEVMKDQEKPTIDEADIASVVAKHTGVPITRLTQGEAEKVLKIEETLEDEIIGQKGAIQTICRSLRRSKADIKDPNRPIGAFLLLGPTGVGKTLLAKKLATHMFGGDSALIKLDMSEYMEKFAVSRMTGSPPGYVGHEEGGQLTEKVRQRPYSVVLFDEIEKGPPRYHAFIFANFRGWCVNGFIGAESGFPQHDHFNDIKLRVRFNSAVCRSRLWGQRRNSRSCCHEGKNSQGDQKTFQTRVCQSSR